jgi:hypothetical protein
MPQRQLFITITSPAGALPTVHRTFQLKGNISWQTPSGYSLTKKSVTVQFGAGGQTVDATFVSGNNWQCTGTVSPTARWGSTVTLVVNADAEFKFQRPEGTDVDDLSATTTFVVQLPPAIAPTVTVNDFASPIVAAQLPISFTFTGSAASPQAVIQLVQYKVENGQFANAINVSGNWSQWEVTLPLPPTAPGKDHVLTISATDQYGTVGEMSQRFTVEPQTPIVIPPGAKTTLSGVPTTSSVTSWTRLEPQCTDADMGTSSSARVFDPLWMLTRQWQMGEFQAEDAGTPIQARVRATSAMLTRCYPGELLKPTGGTATAIAALAYDPTRTPLEVVVEWRRMRAADANDARMLSFAVEAGLHFLRMVELQSPSKSYRSALLNKLALKPLAPASSALVDDATSRYIQSMVGRAPDGRQLAAILRTTGAAQLVLDTALNIATADRPKVQQAATAWLTWYDSMYSEPAVPTDDAWNPSRLEYAVSVGTRLSANTQDDMTFSATEIDGPIDWSSFDLNTQASLTSTADQSFTSYVEASIPAPVSFPGSPAPRFWQMEDARVAYGLVPVGPTDLAHLMMIEYASSYGNDWFVVPLTLAVGSVTRVDSLVVTDTFGVRSLLRPIGDPALPPPYFSLWQSAYRNSPDSAAAKIVTNRFFLPPTLSRTIDSAPLEDVLFMRDEMANLAWAIERTIENPIEQPSPRYEAPDAAPLDPATDATGRELPRYLLSSQVASNWIPLLPVQLPNPSQPANTAGQILSRLKRGAVLKPDGTKQIHAAVGQILSTGGQLLLYDEEVPREGVHITRQRRLTRWTDGSTWLWTSFRNQVGTGEGSSGLKFDQILEPRG